MCLYKLVWLKPLKRFFLYPHPKGWGKKGYAIVINQLVILLF